MESLIKSADFGVCHILNISRSLRRGLGHVKLEDHIRRLRTWVLHGSDSLLRGRTWLLVWGSGKVAVKRFVAPHVSPTWQSLIPEYLISPVKEEFKLFSSEDRNNDKRSRNVVL